MNMKESYLWIWESQLEQSLEAFEGCTVLIIFITGEEGISLLWLLWAISPKSVDNLQKWSTFPYKSMLTRNKLTTNFGGYVCLRVSTTFNEHFTCYETKNTEARGTKRCICFNANTNRLGIVWFLFHFNPQGWF